VEEQFEDQQAEAVKAWWKKYWMSIVGGLAAGAVLVTTYNYWKDYRNHRAEEASALYQTFTQYSDTGAEVPMMQTGQQLIDDYSATPYAELAALMMAKVAYDKGDVDGTIKNLTWAMDHAKVEEVEHIARTRLARVLNDKGDHEAALKLVSGREAGPFTAWYLEVQGDIYVSMGKPNEARKAYSDALALKDLANDAQTLQMKLDSLGVTGDEHE